MSESLSDRQLPAGALAGAAALIAVAVVAAGFARLTGLGKTAAPDAPPVEHVALRFEDRGDGAVAVYRASDAREVEVLAPGTNGFLRGVLRGLVRERRANGIAGADAFELTRWSDGRLSIEDPSTGRSIELTAFGATNAGAFAKLLADGSGAP